MRRLKTLLIFRDRAGRELFTEEFDGHLSIAYQEVVRHVPDSETDYTCLSRRWQWEDEVILLVIDLYKMY